MGLKIAGIIVLLAILGPMKYKDIKHEKKKDSRRVKKEDRMKILENIRSRPDDHADWK